MSCKSWNNTMSRDKHTTAKIKLTVRHFLNVVVWTACLPGSFYKIRYWKKLWNSSVHRRETQLYWVSHSYCLEATTTNKVYVREGFFMIRISSCFGSQQHRKWSSFCLHWFVFSSSPPLAKVSLPFSIKWRIIIMFEPGWSRFWVWCILGAFLLEIYLNFVQSVKL